MNIVRGAYSFLSRHKDRINKFLPIFLASYMVLLILPYVFGRVEVINNFFSVGLSQYIYRVASMVYCMVYLLLVGIANRLRIKLPYIIGGSLLVLIFVISSIIGPRDLYWLDGRFAISIPWYYYLFNVVRFIIGITLFVFMISFIHPIMKSHKDLNIALFILVGITFIASIISFFIEIDELKSLFNGADEHSVAIRSIFQSKNAYGLFLFMASVACSYLIFTDSENPYYMGLYIPLLLFTFMAIVVGCRTAFIACIMLIAYLFIRSMFLLYHSYKKVFYISISSIGVLLVMFILFMTIPALHQGPLKGLHFIITYTFTKFSNAFEGRVEIWSATMEFMKGHYLVFGANYSNARYLLRIYSGNYYNFHSCYVHMFASVGILGSMIYLALFVHIFYLIYKVIKIHKIDGVLVLIFLLSSMIYSLTESAILFIGTSLYTYVTNLLVVVYLQYLLNKQE